MLKSINSHKHQESVSFYTEDIDWNGWTWCAPGVGDRTGVEYDVLFDDSEDGGYTIRDIRLHNT